MKIFFRELPNLIIFAKDMSGRNPRDMMPASTVVIHENYDASVFQHGVDLIVPGTLKNIYIKPI